MRHLKMIFAVAEFVKKAFLYYDIEDARNKETKRVHLEKEKRNPNGQLGLRNSDRKAEIR